MFYDFITKYTDIFCSLQEKPYCHKKVLPFCKLEENHVGVPIYSRIYKIPPRDMTLMAKSSLLKVTPI